MFPRWRANAALTNSVRDRRPIVNVVRCQHPDSDNLTLPGTIQEVIFHLSVNRRTLLVPGSAVMIRPDGPKVLVVSENQIVHSRVINLGRDLGDRIEIVSGIDPDDSLVANPTDSLRDGTEVKVHSEATRHKTN